MMRMPVTTMGTVIITIMVITTITMVRRQRRDRFLAAHGLGSVAGGIRPGGGEPGPGALR